MPFEFTAQKMVYGGEARGHAQVRTVLVPYAVPGERLEVKMVRRAKGVIHACPLRVVTPAPERAAPPCPHFARCGGCQCQYFPARRQTEAKREILFETLRRTGKITWDSEIPRHAAHPWNYRNQVQWKVRRLSDGRATLGFLEAESYRLRPVETWLILSPRWDVILGELRRAEWAQRLGACREVEALADEQDERIMLTLQGSLSAEEAEQVTCDMLARLDGVAGVAVDAGREWRTFGNPALKYAVAASSIESVPAHFSRRLGICSRIS